VESESHHEGSWGGGLYEHSVVLISSLCLLYPEKICAIAKVIGGGMPDYEIRGSMTPLEFKEGSYRQHSCESPTVGGMTSITPGRSFEAHEF